MRTIRNPRTLDEITPELIGAMADNLRKATNLSGTGCTISELPAGISIQVLPQFVPPVPIIARIAKFTSTINPPRPDATRPFYEWVEQELVIDPEDDSNVLMQDKDGGLSSTLGIDDTIIDPAFEYSRNRDVPKGSIVSLIPSSISISSVKTGVRGADGIVYGFYWPAYAMPYVARLKVDLNHQHGTAQVTYADSWDSTLHGGGVYGLEATATNLYHEAGEAGDDCMVVRDTRDNPPNEFILLSVQKSLVPVVTSVGYDTTTGKLRQTVQNVVTTTNSSDMAKTTTDVVQFVGPGLDVPRIGTATSLSVSATSIVYGQAVDLVAAVTKASGTVDPTGFVAFIFQGIPVDVAAVVSGVATLSGAKIKPVLGAGTEAITAMYLGDANFGPSSSAATAMTVGKANVTIALTTTTTGTIAYGDSVVLAAAVSATSPGSGWPAGPIRFYDTTDSGHEIFLGLSDFDNYTGIFNLSTTHIIPGTRTIKARYENASDELFNTGSGTLTLTVAKGSLTVLADDITRVYGDTAPDFSSKLDGFVNGDTAAATVTGAPALSCTADATSAPGTYPITVALGTLVSDLYLFPSGGWTAGTLLVQQAPIQCAAADKYMTRGGSVPAFTGTISGIKNGDAIAASYSCAGDGTARGSFAINPALSGAKLPRYVQSITTGTLTVQ